MSHVYAPAPTTATEFTSYVLGEGMKDGLESGTDLNAIIHGVLDLWNEEDGPQWFVIEDADGNAVAAITRENCDEPELATVRVGEDEIGVEYRCTYVMGEDGRYDHTDITRVD